MCFPFFTRAFTCLFFFSGVIWESGPTLLFLFSSSSRRPSSVGRDVAGVLRLCLFLSRFRAYSGRNRWSSSGSFARRWPLLGMAAQYICFCVRSAHLGALQHRSGGECHRYPGISVYMFLYLHLFLFYLSCVSLNVLYSGLYPVAEWYP